MKEKTRNLIEIHIAVFLFGFAALFGKLINLSPVEITFGRVFIASIGLFLVLLVSKQKFKLKSDKDYFALLVIGGLYAIHWFTFFKSVQVSNVAIAVLTFSTFPIFVTFLEPYFFNEKIKLFDIITAVIAFFGILLIIPEYELKNNLTQGALWGIASGFTGGIVSVCTKKYVQKYSSLLITFYQFISCTMLLLPFIIFTKPAVQTNDILLLVLLGTVFTAISNTLFIKGMTHIKAQLASIITCLEPVYGIIFAAILLNEIPPSRTILGGCVILGAIAFGTLKPKRLQ